MPGAQAWVSAPSFMIAVPFVVSRVSPRAGLGPGHQGTAEGLRTGAGEAHPWGLGRAGGRAGVGCRTLDFITQPGFYSGALESGSGGGVEGVGEKSLMMLGT